MIFYLIEKKIEFKNAFRIYQKTWIILCVKNFCPKLSKGDKRVFLINGKICGAISRVPKIGIFLEQYEQRVLIPIAMSN